MFLDLDNDVVFCEEIVSYFKQYIKPNCLESNGYWYNLSGIELIDVGKIILKNYEGVIGYHATRIYDEDTYKKEGLRPSNIESLNQLAKIVFQDFQGIEEALNQFEIDSKYVMYKNHNENILWLNLYSKVLTSYYGGPEYLRKVAGLLGGDALSRLKICSHPALLKCKIVWTEDLKSQIIKFCCQNIIDTLIINYFYEMDDFGEGDCSFKLNYSIPFDSITIINTLG